MKRLYMIRHGKSEANVDYSILRSKEEKDIELVDQGYLDAVKAGQSLKTMLKMTEGDNYKKNSIFVVSPWTRAYQTYQVVATVLNVPVDPEIDPDVVEHYMNLTGPEENWNKFMDYLNSNWDTEKHMDVQFEGGESLADVKRRAAGFIQAVKEYFADEDSADNLVLVGHGLFIRLALSELDGTPPNTTKHPENGEVVLREIK